MTDINKNLFERQGFGFICADNGSSDIFVHRSEIKARGFKSLLEGEIVEYERRKAINVTGPNNSLVKGQKAPR